MKEGSMLLGPELRFMEQTKVLFDGRPHVFFGGNDYHRLSRHPEVLRAAREAMDSEGLSTGGSRVTTGNHPLHGRLEAMSAAFLGAEEASICAEGFLSNAVALEALAQEFQRFFLDAGAHASLIAPADCLPRDQVHVFQHADPDSLRRELLARLHPGERPLVLTDGVAPGDGELPPLGAYWEVIRNMDGMLLVDDAHGMGTTGSSGKGSPEEAGLPREAFVQTGTLAKAFGAFGGLLAGPTGLAAKVVARSRTFTGTTSLPPPIAAAALRAMEILRAHPELITGLRVRTRQARERLRTLGFPSPESPAPILSVTHRDEGKNQRLKGLLLQNGIYPTFIHYPGCPPGGHFRFTLSSAHTEEEVHRLLDTIGLSCP